MIAQVLIYPPFKILIPKEEQFKVYSIKESDYIIRFYPPGRDSNFNYEPESKTITMDKKDAFLANFIQIDFCKDDFNRNGDTFDPPLEKINKALNFFLIRLKRATSSPIIHSLQINSYRVGITYFDDNGIELNGVTQKFRDRVEFKHIILNKDLWNDTFSLQSDFTSQHWTNLLLDAYDELPDIGPAVVLAFTALEIFISDILNQLATPEKIPPEFWEWINKRSNWQQEPSIEEQYDILLKYFTGHTLKDDKLWQTFQNLRTARNIFVHEGIARISKKSQKPLEYNEALDLINLANEIPLKIREWLPKEIQWELPREYHPTIAATVEYKFLVNNKVNNAQTNEGRCTYGGANLHRDTRKYQPLVLNCKPSVDSSLQFSKAIAYLFCMVLSIAMIWYLLLAIFYCEMCTEKPLAYAFLLAFILIIGYAGFGLFKMLFPARV
jgi:hypothetical protein